MIPLYKHLLGEDYIILPKTIQQLHNIETDNLYQGKCNIKRGTNIISNIFAHILSLPKAGHDVDITVHLTNNKKYEIWNRSFNGKKFQSFQWQENDFLCEKVNFTKLVFKLIATEKMLTLQLQKFYIFGIPQIGFMRPKVIAQETEKNGKFHFFIQTSLPFFGLLVEYEGYLEKVN